MYLLIIVGEKWKIVVWCMTLAHDQKFQCFFANFAMETFFTDLKKNEL